jgi:hypothetical protein
MGDQPLKVFALEREAPPLRLLCDTLSDAGFPVEVGVGITGKATEQELDSPDWEAAFIRWTEPELHEVCLIERAVRGEDEQADEIVAMSVRHISNSHDTVGQMIVRDHLRRTQVVYVLMLLPALMADQDHPAWGALDITLRCLAASTNGLIAVASEGFCDADGELLLAEADDERETDVETEFDVT